MQACADGEGGSGDRMQPEGERHLQHGGQPRLRQHCIVVSGQRHRNICIRIAYGRHFTKEKGLTANRRKSLCCKVAEAGIEPARAIKPTGF